MVSGCTTLAAVSGWYSVAFNRHAPTDQQPATLTGRFFVGKRDSVGG
jgi:hypothetical protein